MKGVGRCTNALIARSKGACLRLRAADHISRSHVCTRTSAPPVGISALPCAGVAKLIASRRHAYPGHTMCSPATDALAGCAAIPMRGVLTFQPTLCADARNPSFSFSLRIECGTSCRATDLDFRVLYPLFVESRAENAPIRRSSCGDGSPIQQGLRNEYISKMLVSPFNVQARRPPPAGAHR